MENKYTCIKTETGKALRANPLMEKPQRTDEYEKPGGSELFQEEMDDYHYHIALLPSFHVSVDHLNEFTIGKEYTQDVDFMVDEGIAVIDNKRTLCAVAIPMPVKPEGDVWEEVVKLIERHSLLQTKYKEVIEELQSKYKITKQ